MIPVELSRFRVVRPVGVASPHSIDLTTLPATSGTPSRATHVDQEAAAISSWLGPLSAVLSRRADSITPTEVESLLPGDWTTQVASAAWAGIETGAGHAYVSAVQAISSPATPQEIETVESAGRSLRIQRLLTTLAADQALPADQRMVQTAEDVRALLNDLPIVIDDSIFAGIRRKNVAQLVRAPGVTDLYVIKDEWNRYEAGELARVINVLPGETFDTRLKHYSQTTQSTSTTMMSTTSQEVEQDQTQSSSLSQASTKDSSLNIGAQGQVEVSAKYGLAQIQTSLGAQVQSAQASSDSRAFSSAFENVSRSVKSVSQTVIEVQTSRTTVGEVDTEDHKLENSGSDVTVGLYRWLVEVHRVQLERYPNRFVVEVQVPEPGAWLRWAFSHAPKTYLNPDPGAFRVHDQSSPDRDLLPTDIDDDVLARLASQWRIQGLTTSPPAKLSTSVALKVDPTTMPTDSKSVGLLVASDDTMTVPNGYQATSFTAQIEAVRDFDQDKLGTQCVVTVGGGTRSRVDSGNKGTEAEGSSLGTVLSGEIGSVNVGTIPVAVYAIALHGFTCVVNVECDLMDEAYRQWQQTTFDQIAAAYKNLLAAYQQEQEENAAGPDSQAGLAGPPALNQARAVNELKRLTIEQLEGREFDGYDQITLGTDDEPNVTLPAPAIDAATTQFFEQAFEWENMIYVCYPYYWGRRQTWSQNATAASEDPVFDQFLNAGSARVVVPARPGFEGVVNFYLYTGQVWRGASPPAPNDPDYLSVADEIQAIQRGAADGQPVGSSWEIALPTTLLWAGEDPSSLPVNPSPAIPAPTNA